MKQGLKKTVLIPYFTKPKKGKNGLFYFQLIAGNGEALTASEGYKTKQSALKGQGDMVKAVLMMVCQ